MSASDQHDDPIWTPTLEGVRSSTLGQFMRFAAARHDLRLSDEFDYAGLWAWSTERIEEFWGDVWDFFDIRAHSPWTEVLSERTMPLAKWFPGATLNFAENALSGEPPHSTALICVQEDGRELTVTWSELRSEVSCLAAFMRGTGVGRGDRVVGYLPPGRHAIVGLLAAASIGAVWSQCAQDYRSPAVIDRFGQLAPSMLIAADGYQHNGTHYDRRADVEQIRDALPTLRHTVLVDHHLAEGAVWSSFSGDTTASAWTSATATEATEIHYEAVEFDHPLWILFSSGTTGIPKGIVHGHGGIVVGLKAMLGLQMDVRRGDHFFWYTSTNWVMWNVAVSALLAGATVVVYDGSPLYPSASRLWRIAAEHCVSQLGTSPGHLTACQQTGVAPSSEFVFDHLRTLGSTGSPLSPASYHWVRDKVGEHVQVSSVTGGTDAVVAFASGNSATPVWPGELSARALGVALESWSDGGISMVNQVGELVITMPIPSMPLYFWNDSGHERYRSAYFSMFAGVWRHGDWTTVTDRGSLVLHGRSDATLNRNGIRLGSAEIYQTLERVSGIADSLVVGVDQLEGGYWMPLFVVLRPGFDLDDHLVAEIRRAIRENASPRHIPDEIIAVPALPHTKTGKRLEVPIKRILQGMDPTAAVSLDAIDDPLTLAPFLEIASRGAVGRRGVVSR